MHVWLAFMYVCHISAWFPQRPEDRVRVTRSGVAEAWALPCGCWELNTGSQQQQCRTASPGPAGTFFVVPLTS